MPQHGPPGDPHGTTLPTEADVVNARSRRSQGSAERSDVLLDRFGTGQEMGLTGVPVAALYEAAKPLLARSDTLNNALGAVAGPEQMVDETTDRPSFGQAMENVGAVAQGAISKNPVAEFLRGLGSG